MAAAGERLDKLTSLRFFAALMVVFFHSRVQLAPSHGLLQRSYFHFFSYGFMGVSIFYVLSGFVISLANEKWRGRRRYLAGRFIRIYPSHWLVTLVLVSGWVAMHYHLHLVTSWQVDLANLALLQAWIPDASYYLSLNAVSWSLSVEMFFYVAFLSLRRLRDQQVYALTIFSYVLLIVMAALPHDWSDSYWTFYIDPLARLPEFLGGMALYRLHRAGALARLPVPRFDVILLLVSMLLVSAFLGSRGVGAIWFYSIIPLPFCLSIMASLLDGRHNGYMTNRNLVLLGEASFGLYLIHHPIIDFFNLLVHKGRGMEAVFLELFAVLLCVGASVIFYKLIESRMTRGLKAYLLERGTPMARSLLPSE